MRKASTHSTELRQTGSSIPTIDNYAIVPVLACAYAAIIGPLMIFDVTLTQATLTHIQNAEAGLPNRIFWPAMAAVSVVIAMRNYSRLNRLVWPPHMICLLAYVAFAGASVLWAFRPETSSVRFAQQLMLLSSIVLPGMLATRTADLMRGMFLCFAVGAILNVYFVYNNPPSDDGYSGYLLGKNALGEFSGVALLLAAHETLQRGLRRMFGIIIVVIATLLLLWSNSKTAFGLALICPLLAGVVLTIRKATRISPAITLLSIPLCYLVVSKVTGFDMTRVSYFLYGDPTFTGRIAIWYFASSEIARSPFVGWGYQSFWLVGSDAPSVVDAPGWVGRMPNAHSGYYDTMLELGYVGFGLLIAFILATLHAIGRVADRDPGRAWFVLAIALYIILYNYLESLWMRGVEIMWVVFVILAVDIARYCQPLPLTKAARGLRTPRPGSPGRLRRVPAPRPRIPIKAAGSA
jgi:exopolysaccharide production protein ExoQ